jgi:hypothetical protein
MNPIFRNTLTALVIVSFIVSIGCKKETTPITPTAATASSNITTLKAFYTANGVQSQSFVINNSIGGTIIGVNGGKYFFPANFFLTPAKTVATGNVNIQLKEIFNPTNMLLSNMPTTSGNHGLLSEGEFYIHATQGGQQLEPAGTFAAHIPLIDSTYQALDSINVWNQDSGTWVPNYGSYISSLADSISVNGDSLNWENADCFYNSSSFYQVTLNATNAPNISQTAIYTFVNGHKAIWSTAYTSGTQFITPTDIPSGAPLTFIGICTAKDGTLYSFFYPYTNPGKNDVVNVTFTATTTSAFKAQMSALK